MRKIPSLFVRDWNGDRRLVTREVNPECQWVLDGEGIATRKYDGTCVLVRDGRLYRRYDAKHGKAPPSGFEPAQPAPDEATGHWPGWLPVGDEPESRWHKAAFAAAMATERTTLHDGTYELCGPHFQANPERLATDGFVRHGKAAVWIDFLTFDGIRDALADLEIEGIVWHHLDGRMAKIKRSDFGLEWPVKVQAVAA